MYFFCPVGHVLHMVEFDLHSHVVAFVICVMVVRGSIEIIRSLQDQIRMGSSMSMNKITSLQTQLATLKTAYDELLAADEEQDEQNA